MKISNEQAERLYYEFKEHLKCENCKCSYKIEILEEIEAANKPMEIEWCVTHKCLDISQHWIGKDPTKICEVKTFVEKI